jgi:1-acyl-sn-glycerol-3-phosphate acyltransferase
MKPYHDTLTKTAGPADEFMRRIFRTVCCEGPPFHREKLLDSPTMIVSSHRSHMDYILLGICCSKLGYRNLRFAAGDNLTRMPYIGTKFASLGAFPIYRNRVSNRRYVLGLCEEVAAMLGDGDNIIVFPEGGRSYGGAMLRLRSGLIAANIIAQHRSPHRQHYYLPFTVSYEVLPEISCLSWIEKGRRLRRDTHSWVRRAAGDYFYYGADLAAFVRLVLSGWFGARYGNVYLDYGEPLAVGSVVDIEKAYARDAKNDLVAHKIAARRMAKEIGRRLARLYRILPMHVVAYELKSGRTRQSDIMARIPAMIGQLEAQGRNCRTLQALSDREVFEQGTAQLRQLNAVAMHGGEVSPIKADIVGYCAHAVDPPDFGQ